MIIDLMTALILVTEIGSTCTMIQLNINDEFIPVVKNQAMKIDLLTFQLASLETAPITKIAVRGPATELYIAIITC